MIDFNAAELLVLAVLAVIIFGPEKLPDLARKAARVFNYLRRIANDARGQLREQLGPEFDDLHLADLNPRALGARLLGDDTVQDLAETRRSAAADVAAISADLTERPRQGRDEVAAASAPAGERLVAFDPEAT